MMRVNLYRPVHVKTLASRAADNGTELDPALEVLRLIAPKGKVVTGDALHCNRRTVAAVNVGGGDWCLALRPIRTRSSDARACFGKVNDTHAVARKEETATAGGKPERPWLFLPKVWRNIMTLLGSRCSDGSTPLTRPTAEPPPRRGSLPCPDCKRRRSTWPHPALTEPSRTRCTGNSTYRSAKTRHATARTTTQQISPSCAAAHGTAPRGIRQGLTFHKAEARRLGQCLSAPAFPQVWKPSRSNAIALLVGQGDISISQQACNNAQAND